MARSRQSFLKRQREVKRQEKAAIKRQKREERQAAVERTGDGPEIAEPGEFGYIEESDEEETPAGKEQETKKETADSQSNP